MSKPFLCVKDLYKSFNLPGFFWRKRQKSVFAGLNLEISAGESVGIVGESGEGKSTLVRLLLGLDDPDSGSITIEGVPVAAWQRANPGRCSAVMQNSTDALNPVLTIGESLAEPLEIAGMRDEEIIAGLLEKTGLSEEILGKFPHELSGGQQQRVCLARALATRPAYVVFDEPFSSQDVCLQSQLVELLKSEQCEGQTRIIVSHDLPCVLELCRRVLFLHRGRVIEDLPAEKIFDATHPAALRLIEAAASMNS